jgi:hypothetical protein
MSDEKHSLGDDQGITPELFNQNAQKNHVLAGLAWVFGWVVLTGQETHWYFFAGGVVLAALKEFLYDQYCESPAVRGSNLEDFSFYCVGLCVATIMCLLKWDFF